MAFSWFDASEAKQFGKALAQFYLAKLPVDTDRADKKYPNKKEFVARKMAEQIGDFKLENKLNLYKKAQLGNAFKWALLEAGYSGKDVDELTTALMHQL